MIKETLAFGTLLLLLQGCSNENLYKSFQPDKSSCRKLPTAQHEACNKSVDYQMNYSDYKKERNKL